MVQAEYTIDQLDLIIDLITNRFLDNPDAYTIKCEYGRIDAKREDDLGTMLLTIPEGYPKYVQLYIGGAHSWTKLATGLVPFQNHKIRKKVQHLGRLMKNKDEMLKAQARQAHQDELKRNANEAFLKAFPEITDQLLETQNGKEE